LKYLSVQRKPEGESYCFPFTLMAAQEGSTQK
jgi:hypothetical protein